MDVELRRRVLQRQRQKDLSDELSTSLFTLEAGHAIVDIGAAQDLIGDEAFEKLSQRLRGQGLRCLRLDGQPSAAHGVGGKAEPLFVVPCRLAGVPGVIRVTVVRGGVPHLLSVGLLESMRNTVNYQELGVSEPMQRLRSGHRIVDVADWPGGAFPVPPHLKEELGLEDGAFNLDQTLKSSAVEVYMCDSAGDVGSPVEPHHGHVPLCTAAACPHVRDQVCVAPLDVHAQVLQICDCDSWRRRPSIDGSC